MAIKLGALKLFGGGAAKAKAEPRPAAKPAAKAAGSGGGFFSRPLPVLGGYDRQAAADLHHAAGAVPTADAALVTTIREGTFGTVYRHGRQSACRRASLCGAAGLAR
jgi:hypothetical protein